MLPLLQQKTKKIRRTVKETESVMRDHNRNSVWQSWFLPFFTWHCFIMYQWKLEPKHITGASSTLRNPATLTFDLKVNACRGTAAEQSMSVVLIADFSYRVRTHTDMDPLITLHMHQLLLAWIMSTIQCNEWLKLGLYLSLVLTSYSDFFKCVLLFLVLLNYGNAVHAFFVILSLMMLKILNPQDNHAVVVQYCFIAHCENVYHRQHISVTQLPGMIIRSVNAVCIKITINYMNAYNNRNTRKPCLNICKKL